MLWCHQQRVDNIPILPMGPVATVIQRLAHGPVADHLHFTPSLIAQLIIHNYNNYINS